MTILRPSLGPLVCNAATNSSVECLEEASNRVNRGDNLIKSLLNSSKNKEVKGLNSL